MFKTEFEANINGFSCYASGKSVTMRKASSTGLGFNIIKAGGYMLAALVVCAIVF